MSICLITSNEGSARAAWLLERLHAALEVAHGSVELVQLREFWLSEVEEHVARSFVSELKDLCHRFDARLIANGKMPQSVFPLVDGLHLNAESLALFDSIRVQYPSFLIGYSAHGVEEACAVVNKLPHLDYLFLSPIFAPLSKKSERPVLGIAPLKQLCASVSCPVYALGGIAKSNTAQCFAAGVHGVAGISLTFNLETLVTLRSKRLPA